MPQLNDVISLEDFCFKPFVDKFWNEVDQRLGSFGERLGSVNEPLGIASHLWSCENDTLSEQLLKYLQRSLPKPLKIKFCNIVNDKLMKHEQKHILSYIYLDMCKQLGAEHLIIGSSLEDEDQVCDVLEDYDGEPVEKLTLVTDFNFAVKEMFVHSPNFYTFVSSLSNLKIFRGGYSCSDEMLKIFSQHCHSLEEIDVEINNCLTDLACYYLTGNKPHRSIDFSVKVPVVNSPSVCVNSLKVLVFQYTTISPQAIAMFLHFCPNLEKIQIAPETEFNFVFQLLHGTDPQKYDHIERRYNLKWFRSFSILEPHVLYLIIVTCPKLTELMLRFTGHERNDKNMLASLVNAKITTLSASNCNMDALLWYLRQKGHTLSSLEIRFNRNASTGGGISRTQIQELIKACTNLKKIGIFFSDLSPIRPDVPYSSFGKGMQYFSSLTKFYCENIIFDPDDFDVLLIRNLNLREVSILNQISNFVNDAYLEKLLHTGYFKQLEVLFLTSQNLKLESLNNLMKVCPNIHSIGPLKCWSLLEEEEYNQFCKDSKSKNWQLNIYGRYIPDI